MMLLKNVLFMTLQTSQKWLTIAIWLTWTIMDCHGLSWTVIDYQKLSWTITDYNFMTFKRFRTKVFHVWISIDFKVGG